MLKRINNLILEGVNFAFETTLASRSYMHKVIAAQKQEFNVTLLFFWLRNVDLAKERVRTRVLEGGHDVPAVDIERRYSRGICNLFEIYLPMVNSALIFDNSEGKHDLIADKQSDGHLNIVNDHKYELLIAQYGQR